VLIAVGGSGHPLNIDGIRGGAAVRRRRGGGDHQGRNAVDIGARRQRRGLFFAQVWVIDRLVDFKPTCGNTLSGVGPAALEMGLVAATGDRAAVRIHAVNTGARVDASIETRGGVVRCNGDAAIDGVPGTAAALNFMDAVGSSCGALPPTGNLHDVIDRIEVTCMGVAASGVAASGVAASGVMASGVMASGVMASGVIASGVIARAADFGLTGHEAAAELDENRAVFAQLEAIWLEAFWLEAGRSIGMGDVTTSVTLKVAILAPARAGGVIAARYLSRRDASCAGTPPHDGGDRVAVHRVLRPAPRRRGQRDAPPARGRPRAGAHRASIGRDRRHRRL
jgi:2-methylaconitate cis-trans-isomerase PrpF